MDAALDSGVRRSPRRVFRLAGAGAVGRLTVALTVSGVVLLGMLGGAPAAEADTGPSPTPSTSSTSTAGTEPTGTDPAGTDPAGTKPPGTVSLSLAPDGAGVLQASQDLGLTVTIANATADALPAGLIHVVLDRAQLETRSELTDWQTPSTNQTPSRDSLTTDIGTTSLAPGATGSFRASLPAGQLGLSDWGAYGLEATFTAGSTIVDSRNTVVWAVGAPAAETSVAVVMPMTAPPGDRGLITADDLATYTAPGGDLAAKLAAVAARPEVTIAIDPRVLVSIRVLGTAAPQSALDWLAALAAVPNPCFPLSFGDSDISIERQAGAASLLVPTSFDYAMATANFQNAPEPDPFFRTTVEATAGATPAAAEPGATPLPTPTPSPAAGTLPTLSDLLGWNYTRTDLAWPAAGSVTTDDLNFFAAGGLTTSMLSSDNVSLPASSDTVTPSAAATVGDKSAVIVDRGLSDALQDATAATTETARDAAVARLSGILAVATGQSETSPPALVAALDRAAPSSSPALTRTLDLLDALPWANSSDLASVLARPALGVSVKNSDEPESRKATVSAMLDYEQQVNAFSSVISKPELLTGVQRATLMAVLAQSWADDSDGRTAAETAYSTLTVNALGSVKIIDGSNVNLLGTSSEVPVLISNDLAEPVTVELQVTPSNGRLVVEPGRIEVVVEAKSQKTARVPVKAAVASGEVNLRLELFNPTGVLISQASPRQINVSADWEGIGTVVIGVLAAALLAFGIVRQVLKRRRLRGDTAPDVRRDPDAPSPAPVDPPSGNPARG